LSERDEIRKNQWCYEPNKGQYIEGMAILKNGLERKGYRLPTEAEWEYACRAGAVTSRYYGQSIDLLDAYARQSGNSQERAWSCGSLLPNDLGLFDMLGNVHEWCHEASVPYVSGEDGIFRDISNKVKTKILKDPRVQRGGGFSSPPAVVRSAFRGWDGPSSRSPDVGFRLAKTCP
jgi:formylglycine-generating enzyme required for sulfatase activity